MSPFQFTALEQLGTSYSKSAQVMNTHKVGCAVFFVLFINNILLASMGLRHMNCGLALVGSSVPCLGLGQFWASLTNRANLELQLHSGNCCMTLLS